MLLRDRINVNLLNFNTVNMLINYTDKKLTQILKYMYISTLIQLIISHNLMIILNKAFNPQFKA